MERHLSIAFCLLWVFVAASRAAPSTSNDAGTRFLIDAPPSSDIEEATGRGERLPQPGHGSRVRRQVTQCQVSPARVTSSQMAEVADAHNHCRGREQATNELKMIWDDGLASLAQPLADGCQWGHGNLYDCNGDVVGQNLFMTAGSAGFPLVNFTYATESWDSERNSYDFINQKCQDGQVCGHWSQVVGAKSLKVGCAYSLCPSVVVSGGTWTNAVIIVCNYSPAGNVVGEAIFIPGPSCTACTTVTGSLNYRGYKCEENLCVPCIPKNDSACQCGAALTCQNGGAYSTDTCVCQCPSGFYGAQCEHSCTCSDVYGYSTCLGWTSFCVDPMYTDFMTTNCAKTCNLCNLPNSCFA